MNTKLQVVVDHETLEFLPEPGRTIGLLCMLPAFRLRSGRIATTHEGGGSNLRLLDATVLGALALELEAMPSAETLLEIAVSGWSRSPVDVRNLLQYGLTKEDIDQGIVGLARPHPCPECGFGHPFIDIGMGNDAGVTASFRSCNDLSGRISWERARTRSMSRQRREGQLDTALARPRMAAVLWSLGQQLPSDKLLDRYAAALGRAVADEEKSALEETCRQLVREVAQVAFRVAGFD